MAGKSRWSGSYWLLIPVLAALVLRILVKARQDGRLLTTLLLMVPVLLVWVFVVGKRKERQAGRDTLFSGIAHLLVNGDSGTRVKGQLTVTTDRLVWIPASKRDAAAGGLDLPWAAVGNLAVSEPRGRLLRMWEMDLSGAERELHFLVVGRGDLRQALRSAGGPSLSP